MAKTIPVKLTHFFLERHLARSGWEAINGITRGSMVESAAETLQGEKHHWGAHAKAVTPPHVKIKCS